MTAKICLIAPYAKLANLAHEVNRAFKLDIDIRVGSMQEGVVAAHMAKQQGARLIISRGGTATTIRGKVDIPVVEIKVTGYDVLRAIHPYKGATKPLGIVGFENVVQGCRTVCRILGIQSQECIVAGNVSDWLSVEKQVQNLVDRYNIKWIIGDNVAVNRLKLRAVSVQMIESGQEAILQAFGEGKNILAVQEEEKKAAERFRTILNSVHDGVIATDEYGVISLINPAAEKIFEIHKGQAVGRHVEQVIRNTRIHKVLESQTAEIGQLQQSPTGYIFTNRIPIIVEGSVKGVVATFQEVSKIQDNERKIRQDLYTKGLYAKHSFADVVTGDARMKRLIEVAEDYAQTDATILIQGENGTGKEIFAQSIHTCSKRAKGPFVAINCSALHPQLLESELFGYVEGAFTGAKKAGKQGLFELAHHGTIFLDEIGDMDKELQTSMLRVLEERKVMRLGSDAIIPIDVRVIAATNADLQQRISQRLFRIDLFYRLNVLNLIIPPLRERKGDIILLVERFMEALGRKYNRSIEKLPAEIISLLTQHDWPGNIRELKNITERIVLSAKQGRVQLTEVAAILKQAQSPFTQGQDDNFLSGTMHEIKGRIIAAVLKEEGYNKKQAAKRLGIDRGTVDRFL